MIRVTRRYRFAASHRLHAPSLPDEENRELYGKCNNPFGHGHNYVLDVTAAGPLDERTGRAVDVAALDGIVREQVLRPFDHGNLNYDVPEFAGDLVPTSENLGREIWRRLQAGWRRAFPGQWPRLAAVRIAETPRNIFEITDETQ